MRGVVFPRRTGCPDHDLPRSHAGPGEVVLEMKASGMCGSDLHQYRRPENLPRAGTGIPASADPVIAGHDRAASSWRSAPASPTRKPRSAIA